MTTVRKETEDSAGRPVSIDVTPAGEEVFCGHVCPTMNIKCARLAGHPGDHIADDKFGNIVWGNRVPV